MTYKTHTACANIGYPRARRRHVIGRWEAPSTNHTILPCLLTSPPVLHTDATINYETWCAALPCRSTSPVSLSPALVAGGQPARCGGTKEPQKKVLLLLFTSSGTACKKSPAEAVFYTPCFLPGTANAREASTCHFWYCRSVRVVVLASPVHMLWCLL